VRIQRIVKRRRKSKVSRDRDCRALAREVEKQEADFAQLAAPYRGIFKGARNLSTREGYGNKK
jgi:hypothetical protein